MASVNKVIIVGNLGRDPEVRYSSEGSAICNITVATSSTWKDKSTGEKREETEWHRIVLYNRLAEIAGEYLRKGRSVYIEGRLKTRKWQDKDTGQDRYSTEIVADQLQMLGGREGGEGANPSQPPTQQPRRPPAQSAPSRQTPAQRAPSQPASNLADMDDDLPF